MHRLGELLAPGECALTRDEFAEDGRTSQLEALDGPTEGVELPTIELAGGSVRCMIAGIHLDRRPEAGAPELSDAVLAINEDNPVTADGRYVDATV